MAAKKGLKRGFTLVELMIVVAIVGVLAALAIYGVRKYIANAKTAEARNALGQLAKDASMAYDREGMAAAVLPLKTTAGLSNRLCDNALVKVPSNQASIQGKKYQSSPVEWQAGSARAGWQCLKFHMKDPQYYMYGYTATGTTAVGAEFTGTAEGDLNGDLQLSFFGLSGKLQSVGGKIELTIAPNLDETNPEE